jgi:hypothetical protein
MVAARIVSKKEGSTTLKVYGAITSGDLWWFCKLEDNRVFIDLDDYSIKEIDRIMGVLATMVEQRARYQWDNRNLHGLRNGRSHFGTLRCSLNYSRFLQAFSAV